MRKPRSPEFRQKVLRAAAEGWSQSAMARQFRISQPTISRWLAQARTEGAKRATPPVRIYPADALLPHVLALAADVRPFSIRAMQAALATQGIALSYGVLRRLMLRHKGAVDAARRMPRSAAAGDAACTRQA